MVMRICLISQPEHGSACSRPSFSDTCNKRGSKQFPQTLHPKVSLLLCHPDDTEDGLRPSLLGEGWLTRSLVSEGGGPGRQSIQVLNFTTIPQTAVKTLPQRVQNLCVNAFTQNNWSVSRFSCHQPTCLRLSAAACMAPVLCLTDTPWHPQACNSTHRQYILSVVRDVII